MNPGKFWTSPQWLKLSKYDQHYWVVLCLYLHANPSTTVQELVGSGLVTPIEFNGLVERNVVRLEGEFVFITPLRKKRESKSGQSQSVRERKQLLQAWEDGYVRVRGTMPTVTVVDRSILKKLHEKHGFLEVSAAISRFFNDAWAVENACHWGFFAKRFDKFQTGPMLTTRVEL